MWATARLSIREVLSRDLGATVIRGLIERTKIDPALISEVIMGCCAMPSDAPNIARAAALLAGVPKKVPGYTVNRNCDSGLEAVTRLARLLRTEVRARTPRPQNRPWFSRV